MSLTVLLMLFMANLIPIKSICLESELYSPTEMICPGKNSMISKLSSNDFESTDRDIATSFSLANSNIYILNDSSDGTTVTTCTGTFVDSGNTSSNYSNNEDYEITFCSDDGDVMTFEFISWDVEDNGAACNKDVLTIYDGPGTYSLLIGEFCTNSPGLISSTGNCITFRFESNSSNTESGWEALITCGIPEINNCPNSNCTDAELNWYSNNAGGYNWNIGDAVNNYSIPYSGGSVGVTVELIDPFNRSIDYDLHSAATHPFDPAGGCDSQAGNCNAGRDDVPANGSISDPWDSDCGLLYTRTLGGYGPGYLTFGIKTATSDETITFKYTFDEPVLLCDFRVADIDYNGLQHTYDTSCEEENPGSSYQDAVTFTASGPLGNVPVVLTTNYSGALILDPPNQTVLANYDTNQNGNISPSNPDGEVVVSTAQAVTELNIAYYNGPADKADELNNPHLYSWWSGTNGATSGVSDDHGIRLDGVQFCICPTFSIAPLSQEMCLGETATATFGISGGVGPYEIYLDGVLQTDLTFTDSPTETTSYQLVVYDSAGCLAEEQFTFVVNPDPAVNTYAGTILCYGDDLNLYENGGDAVSWNWEGPLSFSSNDQNPTIANAILSNGGDYYVTVTDINGCTNTDFINVSIPAPVTCVMSVISDVSCYGGNDGQVSVSGSGGTPPYTYDWGGADPDALEASSYTVTVSDVNDCTNTCSVVVNEPPALNCTTSVISDVSCYGASDGQASVSGSGGTAPYTYNWGSADPSALSVGTYIVTVTDNNNCTSTCSVSINEPPVLNCTASVISDVSCYGGNDGQASVSANGGVSPYSFDWGGEDPLALSAGTYTVTVTDANLCTSTCSVQIDEPPLLTCLASVVSDVGCFGGNDGQASVSASGGVSPYSFNWGGEDPLALSAGTYTITVTDANNCTSTCSVTINEPPVLTCLASVVSDVGCFGGNDGQASVSAAGGVGPYSFNWGGEDPLALSVGTYTVTVTDANLCTSTCSVTINEPPLLSCSTSVVSDVGCFGGDDGQASVSASGGVAPYSFNWGGEDPLSLSAGTYTVTVTDANNCTSTCSVTINEPPLLTCSTTIVSDVSCFGGNDGQASVSASGGVAPYSFNWGGEDPLSLSAGTYTVTVADANSCTSTCSVTINEPPILTCSITKIKDVDCFAGNDGQASISASGGVAPYSFNWGGEDPLSLSAGTYTVTVTDANYCTSTCSVTINEPPLLTCSTTVVSDVSCFGGTDGKAGVSASGGVSPYSFDWGGEDPLALSVGTYIVTVTDANSCTSTCSVTIDEPPLLTCSITKIKDVDCFGGDDGQASVSASSGVAPYSFNWGGEDPLSLSAGTYAVTVTDANNCTSICSVTINEPPILTCSITKIKDVDCFGGDDGQASVSASGGVSPYSFDWGGEDPLSLSAGTYTVTVTDANNCTSTCSVTINEPPVLTCSITKIKDVDCFGGDDGQASVSASGGVAPYSFNWGGEDPLSLSAGTYTVTVTDANNCTSTCSVTINEPPLLTCSTTIVSDVSCFGGNDGQASVSASGGVAPYSFNWGGEDPLSLSAGTYAVTVTDANSCTSTCSVTIDEPQLLNCMASVISDVSCFGGDDGQASVSASGGVSPYSFNWGGEDPLGLSAGTYTVTVADANSCTSTCSVTINEPPILTCSITKIKDVDCFAGNDGQASISASGGVAPYSFNWGGEDPLSLSAGTYTVTVTDANYCTSTCSVTINEPPLLTCSTTKIKDVDCFGGNDGQASVSASGGVEPYSFNWGGEDPLSLIAGSYTMTVTDANNCTSTCSVTIDEPPLLTCSTTVVSDISCFGGTDGKAGVSASGGVSPYSFDWGGEDPLALSVGTYIVTVTDANNCTSTCSVTINEPPLLTCLASVVSDVGCFGGNDSQASVSASGGVSPYSFDWGGEDPLALSVGTYIVTVTDANNCTSTCSVTINEPPLLTCLASVVSDVGCFGGNDSQASVSASGGVSPYSFDWGGEDPLGLSAGTYTATVTDANLCTSTCSVTIDEPPLLTCLASVVSDVGCFGGHDGQASVSASGGVAPYSFNWGGEDPLSLSAGTYAVTVTDANSCTSTCSVTIDEPQLLNCMASVISDVSCFGGDDGQASVSASGGVSPYSFNWGGEDPLSLSAGTYTVTVADANSCTSTCSVTINEPPILTCSITKIKDVDCFAGNDGQASISASGGVAPYSFNWGGEDPLSLSAGTYTVTVTDANYCTSTCSVTINEPPLLTCSITKIKDVDCFGGNDGQASVSASGGVSPYSFNWGGEDPLSLIAGSYTMTVTDANNCTSTCSVTIDEPQLLTCSITKIKDVDCFGGNDGQASVSASGGVVPYSFNWGGEDPLSLSAGTFAVTVTDANNCTSTCSITINEPNAGLECDISITNYISCSGCSDGSAVVNISGGTSPYTEDWGGADPNALSAGMYIVTVTDANDCETECVVLFSEPDQLQCEISVEAFIPCYGGYSEVQPIVSGGIEPYYFDWGGEDPNELYAGTYTLTVTDSGSAECTHTFTIDEPPLLTCSTTVVSDVSCYGGTDGRASVSASGGVTPYSYDWGSANPLALNAGIYTVTVTDENMCTSTCSVTIGEPPLLTCSTTVISDVSCFGGDGGQASVSASGGVSPYSFDWGGEDPLALSQGTYTVTVTDANSCTSTCSVTIAEPPLLTCTITKIKDVDCYVGNDGQASVSAIGGVAPYSFDWGGADPMALSVGTYTVTVTDANSCTSTCSVTIAEPPLLTCLASVVSDVGCFGGNDGQASVSAIGGVNPYSFDWGGADPLALSVGTYTVTVTDANLCTSTCSVTIDEPPLLTCSITKIKDVDCYGGNDGQASVSAAGGVSPYSFDWGGEDPLDLSVGTYIVTVTDANYCASTCSVTIDEPPLLTCSITKIKDVDCYGGNDGQASASASGGVSPYSFDWGGEDPLALSVGTYIVTVTDANYCTSTCSVTIDEPPLLTCSITKIKDVDCYGSNDGQASVSAAGGVSPYSFDWGGEDPLALSVGTYIVAVTDANYCTSTCSVTIDEPQLLTCSITKIKDVDCYGGNDGQASVSASGGVSPYSFDWGGEDPLALSVGTYIVTVTDANYCTSTCSVTIDEPSLLTCSTTVISDVSCFGGDDGQASVSATGGVSPYSFDWGSEDSMALSVGTYIVVVTDANYCTSTCSVTIDEPPLLTCSITKIKDVDCYGGNDGQASVSASGGVSPYSFDWGGEDPLALSVGAYIVTVTDANYCTSTCSVTIDEPPLLTCSITKIKDVDCYGGNDGQASVSATGGVSPYSFDWGGEDPLDLSVGTYIVTVTDANYCASTCSVTIDEPPLLTCSITKIKDVDCYGGNDGQASVSASGGVSPYSFDWGGEDPLSLSVGTYIVTVTDANYCTSTCSVTIDEPPLLTCLITKIKDVDCYGGNDGQASVSAAGGVSPYSFDWGGEDPLALNVGAYIVTVTDANYCTSTCSVTIDETPLLTCSITKIKDVDCYGGNDGQASVSASGGVSPYSFDWGGEDPLALSVGTYIVTVTDANYCTSTCSVTVDEPPILTCSITKIKDADCFGGSDGQASVSAVGGVSPYSFDWGGFDPNSLGAGTYAVTVTDANYCESTCSVVILDASLLTCAIVKIKDVDCFGGNDGQANVSASGGTAPYSFDWGGEDPLALSAGSYVVTVTDANYCSSVCNVQIAEPPLLTCSTTVVSDVSCFGGNNGQASVSATGGVSPYSFDWGGEDPLALSVGTYIVTVTDANYCTSTCSVTIDEPPLLTCSITKIKDVDCYGGNDGQASVSAVGGVLPYSFDWGGEDPLALSQGTYTMTVTDANYCTSTCSVTIDEPPLLTCSITKIKDVDCYGGNDGQASVSASGGVSPYSFDWGGEDPLALSVGTYIVTVTDANYCTSTCSVTIDEPPLLTCSITKIKDVDCYGGNDGQASVSASGGVSPYSFDWGGEDPLALSVGTYIVTVTDANYCTSTCSVTIDEPPLLTCSITKIKDVDCYGSNDGQASVSAAGGVSPYSFDWGGEDPLALSVGTYIVTVTDANNCTSTCSVTIDEPPLLTCSITKIKDVDCYGGNDGQASVSAVGGVSPYSFDWGGEDPLSLSVGTYIVTVTDANYCTSTCSVTIDEPPLLTCSTTVVSDVSCFGGNDGQASVSATGGLSPYSFDWGGEDPLSLSVGTYTVTVTDANLCTSTCSVIIDEPTLLTCSITKIKDVDCYGGNDGQASVSAVGGVSPYSFDWGGEDPLSLSVGTYIVTVTDANYCTNTCSVTIDEPPLLTCSITKIKDVDCYGGNDGQASVSAFGGVSPYSFDWGGEDPLSLSVGTYIVTVTDANYCTSTCSVTIDEPPLLTCSITKIKDVDCYGGNDGQASVSATGGVSPYSFDWGGEDPLSLSVGTYTVTVTDANLCTSTCSLTIDEPTLLTCSITKIKDVDCYGGNDGQASVSATGGVSPYSFDWGGEDPLSLSVGTYIVTVTDANYCTSTCSVTIDEPPLLTCSITKIKDVDCYGGNDGQASVSATGGVSPYSFDWGGEDPLSLSVGTYTVTVTDANLCTSTCSLTIDEPTLLTCSITKIKDVDCYGGTDGQADVSASGGVSPYSFDWGGEDPLALSAGVYTVTVTDSNYCTSTCSVTIAEPPILTCSISKIKDADCFGGSDGQANVSAFGGVAPYSFDWGGFDPNSLGAGTYTVTVTDTNYCTSTCSVEILDASLLTCDITKIKDVDCYGGSDGQASVSASGGTAPYSFDWGGEDPMALSAGSYVVTVTDANYCSSVCNVQIYEPPLLTCSTTVVSDVSCFGGTDGQASVSANGSASPYSFDWGGEDPMALAAGSYVVTVTDANYCTSTCYVDIYEPPLLACTITKIKDVDCYGGTDGQASVSASGGVSPYSFDWGGADPLALSAGVYTVTVTDGNNCTTTCNVTIDEPPLLTCALVKLKDVDCFDGNDGQASVSASGGVSPYSFDWGGEDPLGLSAGSYVVTVTDANYCTSTCSVEIEEFPMLGCLITKISDVNCYGGFDGQVSVSANGGAGSYTFNWGGEDPLALSAGLYTVTVTDNNSCTSTCSIQMDEPPLLTCSITKLKDVDCYGGNDGQANVSASGGIGPYTFDWGGEDPLALSAGSYTVTVTCANNCTSTCNVEIDEPPLLTCSTTVVSDVGCYGGTDGQASVNAIGGVAPYGFNWGGADPSALSAGTYTVTVTDSNSCTSTCNVEIDEPDLLICSVTKIKDADCFGGSDGQASVSASGGTTPYSFDWGGFDPGSLGAGTYTVTVTDANYCTSTCSVEILDASLLTCSIVKNKDVDCYGGTDGQASVSASGGTAPYSFDWGGADPLALSVGTYTVTVTDANLCTSTCSVTINEPPLLTCLASVVSDVGCFGDNDGQASVSAIGGVAPYSFDWGGVDPMALSVGTYTVTVTDANYCTSLCSVEIYEPPLLTCSITKIKDVDCYGGNDGQASVSATGGVSPYSFDWGGVDPLALSAGSYTVTVTDANYCTSTCYVDIYEPPLLTCTITKIKDVDCYGGTEGQASVSATGGVSPYSFDWGGADPLALSAGTYTVTVTDANYCTSTCFVDIDEPPLLACTITKIKDADCFGGSDGQASVNATGGVAPYTIDWGGANPLALSAGSYTVTVTDANYCTSTCSVQIEEPPLLTCSITKLKDVDCYGGNDGQASVSATGGVAPYSFDWGGADPLALSVGTYTVTVTDGNLCTSTCGVTIAEPPLLTCSITKIKDVDCYGDNDGQASVSAIGGVAPYSFDWGGADPLALSVGTYTVTVTDANLCTSTCSVTINEPPFLTCLASVVSDVGCFGGTDGQASVSATGGASPYNFDWGGADPLALSSGSYTVTVTDANYCTSTCYVDIYEPPLLTCTITKIKDVDCYGDYDGQATVNATGGVAPYSFDWGGFDPNSLGAGTYTVTVTDANYCSSTCSIDIYEPLLLSCEIVKIKDVDCFGGNDGQAMVRAFGGAEPYSFDWGGADPLALSAGTYTVTVTDANYCSSTCTVDIYEPPVLACNLVDIVHVECYGDQTGSVELYATGGTPPYSFDWGGADPNMLFAGTYEVIITDALGCEVSCRIIVDEPPALSCSGESNSESCYRNDGDITIYASGGVPPYEYSIDNGETYQSNNQFTALQAGTYLITVRDANNCITQCEVVVDIYCYDLAITKSVLDSEPFIIGSTVRYNLRIENQGLEPAYNAEFLDEPEAGLIYVGSNADSNPNISEQSAMLFRVSELLPGEVDEIEVEFRIDELFEGNFLTNQVQIVLDDGDDFDSDPDTGYDEDEDGDGNGDDDDEDGVTIPVTNRINIGDYVWFDRNGDGIQDPDEPGIPSIEVRLYNKRDFLVKKTFTNNDGLYLFENIVPGEYYVRFIYPDSYLTSPKNIGADDLDSDIDNSNGKGTTQLYTINSDNYTIDAGLLDCAVVSGTVWFDYNQNDVMDAFENGINNITVELYRYEDGEWVLWTTELTGLKPGTASDDGYYELCVDPGRYYIRFVNPPETLVPVLPFAGNPDVSSTITHSFGYGTTSDMDLLAGEFMINMNAGYYPMGTIGDLVWLDKNDNGLRESNEPGVANVTVRAVNSVGQVVSETISDEDGYYTLDYLEKDQYYIEVVTPLGMGITQANVGNDDSMDSDIDGSNGVGTSDRMMVLPGIHVPHVDIGILESVLPVEWLDFYGRRAGSKNHLNWEVATEINVSHYEVERSEEDEFDFVKIAEVDYKEPRTDVNYYDHEDYDIESGKVYYYRIKQIDLDGMFDYSKIISLQSDDFTFEEVQIGMYPNPAYDRVMLTFDHYTTIPSGEIMFMTTDGKLVRKIELFNESVSPDRPLSFDISDLPEGVYTWLLVIDDFSVVDRLVILD